jgi:hypothetical protein
LQKLYFIKYTIDLEKYKVITKEKGEFKGRQVSTMSKSLHLDKQPFFVIRVGRGDDNLGVF